MIRLVVITEKTPTAYTFEKTSVVIGGSQALKADVCLNDKSLQDNHVQIFFDNGKYLVSNSANDPFVTLNGLPFGKQPIVDTDIIEIHSNSLQFFSIEISSPKIESLHISFNADESAHAEVSTEVSTPNKDLTSHDIEELMRQVEALETSTHNIGSGTHANLDAPAKEIPPAPKVEIPQEKPSPSIHKPSLKDYYLSEYDDEPDKIPLLNEGHEEEMSYIKKRWNFYLKALCAFVFLGMLGLGIAYLLISDKSEDDEIKAARSLADVAMALTHAQIKNIHPQNQNWSDPEFIKNNLTSTLASQCQALGDFDTHGQLANCPYMIRIYTSSNLSQFLVIAQPIPSLLHWIIPRSTIVIDSHTMEMRKINDVKSLNRLLVNANTLDHANASDITALTKQGSIIPLSNLVSQTDNNGFLPPKALAFIKPNAENFVYNAPRYCPLGQCLIERSIELEGMPADSQERMLFHKELTALKKFKNMVIYSSEGIQQAMNSQKALSSLAPNEDFLIAYLQINAKGLIIGTHLLMNDTAAVISEHGQNTSTESLLTEADHPPAINDSDDFLSFAKAFGVSPNDPLLLQLKIEAKSREQVLRPITEELTALIAKQSQYFQPDFANNYAKLQKKYTKTLQEQNYKTVLHLWILAQENAQLPTLSFLDYLQALGLDTNLLHSLYAANKQQKIKTKKSLLAVQADKTLWNEPVETASEIVDASLIHLQMVDLLWPTPDLPKESTPQIVEAPKPKKFSIGKKPEKKD